MLSKKWNKAQKEKERERQKDDKEQFTFHHETQKDCILISPITHSMKILRHFS